MTSTNCSLTLPDGRILGFAEYGSPSGKPVLFFHGTPGSRLEQLPEPSILKTLGIRLIVPERPGYGLSDPKPNRSILDWADDIQDLMDQLEIESCTLVGFSGGGPYAAACAHQIPKRVSQLILISSMAPFDNPYGTDGMNEQSLALFSLARSDPKTFETQIKSLLTDGETLFHIMTAGLPQPDARVFELTSMADMYRADMAEAIKRSVTGIVEDMILLSREWGYSVSDISCKTYLWQGLADMNVPPVMGKYLGETIPGCKTIFLPGEGHFMLFTRWQKIFGDIVNDDAQNNHC